MLTRISSPKAWWTDGHIDLERMKHDNIRKKYFESEDKFNRIKGKYDRIQDKHEDIMTMLKGRAQELQQIIDTEIELSLGHGVRQMKEVGMRLILSKNLNEQLDNINVQLVVKNVYHQLCLSSEYPDIAREVITIGKGHILYPTLYHDLMDEKTGHEDNSLLDTNYTDSNLNDLYVRVIHNTPPKNKRMVTLKLRKDQEIKFKPCSSDGKTGYGWTKLVLGIQKWVLIDTVLCDCQSVPTAGKPLLSLLMTASVVKSSQKTGKFKSFRMNSLEIPLYTLSRKYAAP